MSFKIQNGLDNEVIIECYQKGRNAGRVTVKPEQFYSVEKDPLNLSLWWCNVWMLPNKQQTHFDVHTADEKSYTFKLMLDGIYKMDLEDGECCHFMNYTEG